MPPAEVVLLVPALRSSQSNQPPLPMPWSSWQEHCGPSSVISRVHSSQELLVSVLVEELEVVVLQEVI